MCDRSSSTAVADSKHNSRARCNDAVRRRRVSEDNSSERMLTGLRRSYIQICVENASAVDLQYLNILTNDSHTSQVLDNLQDHELEIPPGEAYELDLDLSEHPVLTWIRPEDAVVLAPGERIVLNFRCYGKVDWCVCTFAYCLAKSLRQ